MHRRIIALALTMCLSLTACGGEKADSQGQPSLLAQAAETGEAETLLVIDGREIPTWRYLYWLTYTCDRIQQQYRRSGLPLDWNAAVSGGTLADYARDQALADTALYATVENWAEQYGVTVPEDAAPPASMPEADLPPEQMAELERVGQLYAALYALYCEESSPLAPEEEALARFAREQGWLTLERILIPYGENRAESEQRAAEIFARLNGAADQAAEFAALTDGSGALTVKTGDGTLDASLEEAAAALAEGQISGILESEEGYSILRRLATETAPIREAYFDHLLQTAAKNAAVQVTELYAALDVPAFYRSLEALREEESG